MPLKHDCTVSSCIVVKQTLRKLVTNNGSVQYRKTRSLNQYSCVLMQCSRCCIKKHLEECFHVFGCSSCSTFILISLLCNPNTSAVNISAVLHHFSPRWNIDYVPLFSRRSLAWASWWSRCERAVCLPLTGCWSWGSIQVIKRR